MAGTKFNPITFQCARWIPKDLTYGIDTGKAITGVEQLFF